MTLENKTQSICRKKFFQIPQGSLFVVDFLEQAAAK